MGVKWHLLMFVFSPNTPANISMTARTNWISCSADTRNTTKSSVYRDDMWRMVGEKRGLNMLMSYTRDNKAFRANHINDQEVINNSQHCLL
jgi:hypothetical protein